MSIRAPKAAKPANSGKIAVQKAKATASALKKKALANAAATSERAYHHGDLHEALLLAAKRVAEREGLAGLTLRAVAREAGVSHAAPAHHFGDVTGLLSELAAIGFKRFREAMSAAAEQAKSAGISEGEARAKAYVGFARDNPCMFQLMFRAEKLDYDRPMLHEASVQAFENLARAVGAKRHEQVSPDRLTLAQAADIARLWSMVHGFALLYLDGRLHNIMAGLPPGTTEETLLAAMLKSEAPGKS
ncbi:MAG: WHG domain-containing protein [Afipia sp.]|nr:WHG domain-containing protein [Afipia sp.]